MASYTFTEVIALFEEKLGIQAPREDVEAGVVELHVDGRSIIISVGEQEGSLQMQLMMGLMVQPIHPIHLRVLSEANFLGIHTAGCSFAINSDASALLLVATTTPGTDPYENWEHLHRIAGVAGDWEEQLSKWDEFVTVKRADT